MLMIQLQVSASYQTQLQVSASYWKGTLYISKLTIFEGKALGLTRDRCRPMMPIVALKEDDQRPKTEFCAVGYGPHWIGWGPFHLGHFSFQQ